MHWGPQEEHASGYAEELAAFVREQSGGPAVLWPEHEAPSQGHGQEQNQDQEVGWESDFGLGLVAGLAGLIDRPVVRLPSGQGGPTELTAGQLLVDQGDLLLIQLTGTSSLQLAAPEARSGPAVPQPPHAPHTSPARPNSVLRLREGEVAFLPSGSLAALRHEPGTRHVLLRIGSGPTPGAPG